MARIETWFSQDLKEAVKVRYIDGNVFSADNQGNVVGVVVMDEGEPATLGGTVAASIIRADGVTVAATGSLSGNKVSAVLPQSAYAVPGVISIVLKLTSGSDITTLLAVVGNVYRSTTDSVIDPGTIIPSIETLIAEIDAAVASIPADYSDLWTTLAPTFSTSTTYYTGQYAVYNGHLYRFINQHTGTWDDTDAITVKDGVDLYNISNVFEGKVSIENKPIPLLVSNWKAGYYKNDGTYDTWARAICNDDAMQINADGFVAVAPSGYSVKVYEYNTSGTFVKTYGEFNTNASPYQTHYIAVKTTQGYKYCFTIGMFAPSAAPSYLTQAFINTFKIYPVYSAEVSLTNRVRQYVTGWQTGEYTPDTGEWEQWSKTLCTKNPYIATMDGYIKVIAPDDAHLRVTEYASDGTFLGVFGNFNTNSKIITDVVYLKVTAGRKYNFTLGLFESGGGASRLNQTYMDKICLYTNIPTGVYDLESTGDTTDRTADIQSIVDGKGSCYLAPGLFCTNGIMMPDNATLQGCGAMTELRLLPSSDANLWTFGNKTFIQETIVVFNDALPAGRYKMVADVVSDDTATQLNGVTFYTGEPYVYNQTGAGRGQISRGAARELIVTATKAFTAIGLYSSTSYALSEGKTATFSNISLVRIPAAITLGSNNTVKNLLISGSEEEITVPSTYGNRNGIGYYGEGTDSTIKRGVIDGCFIRSFAGGGIDLNNTGYGSQGLNVCNCYIWNCYCGFHGIHFTEFHRVTGCCFNYNHIAIVNNGGNNQFTGCSCTGNAYGIVMDNSSGEHNNGTHGGCSGCIFQHNYEKTIYINTEASGFMFSACNIDPDEDGQTGIEIVNSTRIIFDACNFMAYFKAVITNGGMVLFNACNFRTTLDNRIFITNNNAVRFNACYTANGTEVNPVSN